MRPCDFRCPGCQAKPVKATPDTLDQSYGALPATRYVMEPCPKCVELVQANAPAADTSGAAS